MGHEGQGEVVGYERQGDMAHVVIRGHYALLWSVVGSGGPLRERVAMSVSKEGRSAVTRLQKRKLERKKKGKRKIPTQSDVLQFS